jgi:hypothetical protein
VTKTRAFGLDIDSGFELPGFPDDSARDGTRKLRLDLADEARLDARFDGADGERISEIAAPDGTPLVTIDQAPERGYRIWAAEFGRAWIAADGREALIAPVDRPPWRWQRYLTGQVMPFVAVLQGLEVFHASVVVIDGRAVAVVAHSGSGKTSLGLNMALMGAPFLADDVAVLEPKGNSLTVHPGVGLSNIRHQAVELAGRVEAGGLGTALGTTEHETRMSLRRHDESVPLGAMFFLQRVSEGEDATIERMAPVDPRLLLAGTFNLVLRQPDRLLRQLDVCSLIAGSAALFKVDCPPPVDAPALAEQIMATASALEPA